MQETTTLQGGCLCGTVRYEWRGTELSASYCHCPDCRKATGGPYTVGVGVDAAGLTIRSGQTKGYTKIADSGREITREFCPECGGTIVEAQSMIDNEPIPSIYCMDCGWHEPIPPQPSPAPAAGTPEDEEAVEAPTEAG